jgi:hypothetical protein
MCKLLRNINRQEKGTEGGHCRGFRISKLRPERGTRPESLKNEDDDDDDDDDELHCGKLIVVGQSVTVLSINFV